MDAVGIDDIIQEVAEGKAKAASGNAKRALEQNTRILKGSWEALNAWVGSLPATAPLEQQ